MTTKLLLKIFLGSIAVSAVYVLTMFYSLYYSGIAVLIVHICLLGLLYISTSHQIQKYTPRMYIHIGLILLLSARYALYTQVTISIVNAGLLIFLDISLFAQFALTYIQGASLRVHIQKSLTYIGKSLNRLPRVHDYISKIGSDIGNSLDMTKLKPSKKLIEICASVGLLLLLLLIIVPLLKSADLGFSKIVDQFFDAFKIDMDRNRDIDGWTVFKKIMWIIVGGWILSASIFVLYDKNTTDTTDEKSETTPFYSLSATNMYIVLGGINLVYILFVITQFAFMFNGNHQAILDRGIESYSDYIHRGFRQLVVIAVINILLYFVFWKHKKQKIRTSMLGILVGCTLVVLVSACMRTMMYIQAYGLTELRSLVIRAIVVIGLICLYLIYRLRDRRSSPAWVIACAAMGCRVIYGYINIDTYIARYNMQAIEVLPADYEENREEYGPFKKSQVLDEEYIYNLSFDALDQKIWMHHSVNDERYLLYTKKREFPWYNRNRSIYKVNKYIERAKIDDHM